MVSTIVSSASNAVLLSWGWRRAAIALVGGGASALAMPPLSLFPILWITFPVLVLLIDGALGKTRTAAIRAAAVDGWLFGFGYFLCGLWWIGSAFLVEAEIFAWLVPFAMAAMPAGLALFWAAAAAFARAFWFKGPGRLLVLTVSFGLFEFLRGTIFTGFPWNAPGYALATHDAPMQAAALIGLHGLSLIAFFVFAAPVLLLGTKSDRARGRSLAVTAACIFVSLIVFGIIRLAGADNSRLADVSIRIVQPNIPQTEKWKPENRSAIFNTFLELSARETSPGEGGIDTVTHLIWPETALPFLLTSAQTEMGAIAALLPPETHLVTGALRIDPRPGTPTGRAVFNSIYVIDPGGAVVDAYDKVHLVPFGEYLPFQSFFDSIGLTPLTGQIGGFTAGRTRRSLSIGSAPPALPLVCYEAIFPYFGGFGPERPGWLLNVTNDAWFGETPGPHQHFHQARMRAVEQGLPLVRSANTGISAIVDSYGRVRESVSLGQRGIVDGRLPSPISTTHFSRYGGVTFAVLVALFAILAVFFWRRRMPSNR